MSGLKDLPQAEFEVMEVLWRKGEGTVKEVQAELCHNRKVAYTTVATLLNRLREKGYVQSEERNFAYLFKPLVERDQVVRRKLGDLVKDVLRGDVSPLAAYLAENKRLTPKQIAALEEILGQAPEDENDSE